MGQSFRVVLSTAIGVVAFTSAASALNDPPSQAGRLAYTEGTVSFHDDEQAGWSRAIVNTPLTSGDSIWTEPNARSEISVAGTRVRMDGSTQLNLLEINDQQTRLQVGQGRVDIKTFSLNPNTPYQVVTPRGTINLRQQGDYYVEAGSTQDATRLGVRSGAAQIQSLNGQTVTVNPGQVGEIFGDTGALQLRTLNTAPPAQPAYWSARDRQINYDVPTQYLSAGITGYEDLNAYGSWSNDSLYGNVWTPRSVPTGWQPYKNGHWSYVKPWGWTWVDDQPWGYAPSHYGRWANRDNQWVWVPPQRETQPVYAPALVDFIGGIQLVQALLGGNTSLGNQNSAPVGWFPLGPREAYVPSYSTDRDYYARLNSSNQVQQQALDERWLRAQRREAYIAGQNSVMANQRFTTVIPSDVFVNSQPVARAALKISPAQIAAAPVAPVAAPPAPTASLAVAAPASAPAAKVDDPKAATPAPAAAADPKAAADAKAKAEAQAKAGANADLAVGKTAIADMPTLAKPTTTPKPVAPGPKLATAPNTPAATTKGTGNTTGNAQGSNTQGKTAAPPLMPRTGAAPPVLKDDNKAPPMPAPATPQAKAPTTTDIKTPTAPTVAPPPASAPAPAAATPPAATPDKTPKPAAVEPAKPTAVTPPSAPQATKPADPAKPAAPPAAQQAKPESAKPAEPAKPATPLAAQPAMPAVPPQIDNKAPDKGATATPRQPTPTNAPAAQPPKPPTPAEQTIAVPQPPAAIPQLTPKPDKADDKKDEPDAKPDAKK